MMSISAFFAEYVVDPIVIPLLGGPAVHNDSPQAYFATGLTVLLIPAALLFLWQTVLCHVLPKKEMTAAQRLVSEQTKPPAISAFQLLYLPVFWLLRTAFWMSGPYFVPVYAKKAEGLISIDNVFRVGFASAAVLLPAIASIVSSSYTDEKSGTIAAAVFYALGAASTQVSNLPLLLAGRGCGNIGTGLLNTMPEAWVSSEIQKTGADPYGRWLSKIFATAFAFDSIVAILAGQVAAVAAERIGGPEGPFQVSPLFLALAVVIIGLFWTDTDVPTDKDGGGDAKQTSNGLSLQDAANVFASDTKVLLLGLVQCSFEAATYLFVLNQAQAIGGAVSASFGADSKVPNGLVFASYMTATLLGSCIYGHLSELRCRPEGILSVAIIVSAVALGAVGTLCSVESNLTGLTVAFFVFEVMAGLAKPSFSWLRSKYLPIRERSILMTAFSAVFNLLVLVISLSNNLIGDAGVWRAASALLVFAFVCLLQLRRIARQEAIDNAPRTWRRVRAKWVSIARVMQIRRLVQGIAKQAASEGIE